MPPARWTARAAAAPLLAAAAAALLLAAAWAPARAAFGLPESAGLLRLRTVESAGLGSLRTTYSQSYHRQELGLDSGDHWFTGRLGLAFGLGEMGQMAIDTRMHGLLRSVSPTDAALYQATGNWDWSGGAGDSDLSLKIILPVPLPRIALAGEGAIRLPTGDDSRNLSVGSRDYEVLGILSIDLHRGSRFVPTRLHLNAGVRVNRDPDGFGLPPDPAGGAPSPFPPYYPPRGPGETESERRQRLLGVGLEFMGQGKRLYGELVLEELTAMGDAMVLREQLWQLGLGFRARAPWRLELFGAVDINLSRDDLDTDFEPHYPRLAFSLGVSRSWQILAGDPDRDGVRGEADLCPDTPEDFDGFRDGDGCPDPDNDEDGVPDLIDLAPFLAEDFDGFEDEDGRPDLDNDNDGIPDRDDLCPDRPEDFDGFEDEDGCPDRDNGTRGEPGGTGAPSDAAPAGEDETPGGDEAPESAG